MPAVTFRSVFLVVFSHFLADYFLTDSAVSLLWPLETHFASGVTGWGEVVHTVACGEMEDAGIVLCAAAFIAAVRWVRARRAVGARAGASFAVLSVPSRTGEKARISR
jgi:membrane-bound metal-dependent hydrolase YbcI (DUF457 family)